MDSLGGVDDLLNFRADWIRRLFTGLQEKVDKVIHVISTTEKKSGIPNVLLCANKSY